MSRKAKVAVVAATVAVLVVGVWLVLDRPDTISSYRVVDAHTLAIQVPTSTLQWTRVTSVVETSSRVTIAVSSFRIPLPGTGGVNMDYLVHLQDRFLGRTVVDAVGLAPVPEVNQP